MVCSLESLVPNGTSAVQDDFETGKESLFFCSVFVIINMHTWLDYKKFIDNYLDNTTPAYIFVRFDEKGTAGEYKWLFLCYVPDGAKVRDKMLYASTRATLTKELGDYRFVDNIYGTEKVSSEVDYIACLLIWVYSLNLLGKDTKSILHIRLQKLLWQDANKNWQRSRLLR